MKDIARINENSLSGTLALIICMIIIVGLSGCVGGSYGRLTRDTQITESFKNNEVPSDYRYYYYGYIDSPYVIIGVESKYDAESKMWREVDPNTDEFKNAVKWVWEDYDYNAYGSYILDPSGNRVGVCYTSIRTVVVKFGENNRVMVIPHTPFLWGPAAELETSYRSPG